MRVRQRRLRLAGALAVALTGMAGLLIAASASASPARPAGTMTAKTAAVQAAAMTKAAKHAQATAHRGGDSLPAGERQVCPTPNRAGLMACLSVIRGNGRTGIRPALINPSALRPADLQQAYNLVAASASQGNGMTVAIVDGGDDPRAAADLATYRRQWGLPACDTTTGAGCVVKVNQDGESSPLPIADPFGDWQVEESLDLDMVSAICPNCRILLVEANLESDGFLGYDPTINDFAAAEDSAAALGAKFISNSWGGLEYPGIQAFDSDFQHPGVAITVSAGDDGYGPSYPATSQFVTSVGGTSLAPAPGTSRGWTETVWDGTGSGCSATEAKPTWQAVDDTSPDGCLNRTDNDVSAVGDPSTGVWIYDSYPVGGETPGWQPVGGTSASSPVIAAVYALAGSPEQGTYPASYLYQQGHAAGLYPVTSGSNGVCETYRAYLCNARAGYNAPAGLGTPDGTAAFAPPTAGNTISVTDPGTRDLAAGATIRLAVQATDSAGASLTYSAQNLPHGLSVSASGVISGTLPKTAGTSTVTVTATDASGAKGSASFRIVVVPSLTAGYHRATGQVVASVSFPSSCLDDTGNSSANNAKAEFAPCVTSSAGQHWALVPDGRPDGLQTLQIHGKCLDLTSTKNATGLRLWPCNGAAGESWSLAQQFGSLQNPVSGRCLTDPNASSFKPVKAEIYNCESEVQTPPSLNLDQSFLFPAGPILSAVGKMCAEDPGNSKTSGTAVRLEPCDGSAAQAWDDFSDFLDTMSGNPSTHHGLCLSALLKVNANGGLEVLEGTSVVVSACTPAHPAASIAYLNDDWVPTANGEIYNTDAGLCLADPGSSTAKGTKLVLADCEGDAGEIWGVG
jgi:Ricin-type beta-trefoil lectin domain/Putative Ig domain